MNKFDYSVVSSDNIRFLLTQNKMSIRQLAEKISIAPTTLNDSLKSKKGVSIDTMIKIADYFNITVNDLCNIDSSDNKSLLQKIENSEIVEKYNRLDKYGKDLVMTVIEKELERLMNDNKNN